MENYYLRNWSKACSSSSAPWLPLEVKETWVGALMFCSRFVLWESSIRHRPEPHGSSQQIPYKMVSITPFEEQSSKQLSFLRLSSPFEYPIPFGVSSYFFLRCHGRRYSWHFDLLLGIYGESAFLVVNLCLPLFLGIHLMEITLSWILGQRPSTCFYFRAIMERRFWNVVCIV